MLQKTIWMRFLTFGISLLFLSLNSCDGDDEVERRLDVDIIYINQSGHTIIYNEFINNERRELFTLAPSSQEKIEVRGSGSSENQTIDNCCSGVLGGFQDVGDILIEYDNGDHV